jgi:hypothetical protein
MGDMSERSERISKLSAEVPQGVGERSEATA